MAACFPSVGWPLSGMDGRLLLCLSLRVCALPPSFFQLDSSLAVGSSPRNRGCNARLSLAGFREPRAGGPHSLSLCAPCCQVPEGGAWASGRGGTHSVRDLADVGRGGPVQGSPWGYSECGLACLRRRALRGRWDTLTCPVLPSQRVTWLRGTLSLLLTLKFICLMGIQSTMASCSFLLRRSLAGVYTAGVRRLPVSSYLPDKPAQSVSSPVSTFSRETRAFKVRHRLEAGASGVPEWF